MVAAVAAVAEVVFVIIKAPKPGLGFGIRDLGFWDLGFGLA